MRLIFSLPLTLLPLIAYNMLAAAGGETWNGAVFSFNMVSGANFALVSGDVLVIAGLFLLFIEMLKATRTGSSAMIDHALSMLVFVAYLVEFLVINYAATSVFFILLAIALIDVIAGFSISISSARRDVQFGGH